MEKYEQFYYCMGFVVFPMQHQTLSAYTHNVRKRNQDDQHVLLYVRVNDILVIYTEQKKKESTVYILMYFRKY